MNRPALAAALLAIACGAFAEEGSRFGGEVLAGGAWEVLHGIPMRTVTLRAGLGARRMERDFLGLGEIELGWVTTLAGRYGRTGHGLQVREGRLGLGARARKDRFTFGLDAEVFLLTVRRYSFPGDLTGTGLAARAGLGVDLVQTGTVSLYAALDGSLAAMGPLDSSADWIPDAQVGLGVRW